MTGMIVRRGARTAWIGWPPRECTECHTVHAMGDLVPTEVEPGELDNHFICWPCMTETGR